ncbi:MAG: methyltransferase domain-containing protein [Proteobacteria bacterium]|nr:methyltransferase domain-containing protein [Pseudomonadota bacterium]
MSVHAPAGSASANDLLWGQRAKDWAAYQEVQSRPMFEAVLERAAVHAGTDYADLGCGAGLTAHLACMRGARVCGLDASANMLAIARDRCPDADLRQGDLESLPWPDDTFDVVTGFNSFQFAANPLTALKEAQRIARSNAMVAIVVFAPPETMQATAIITALAPLLPQSPLGAGGPFAFSEESALKQLAASAGLEAVELFDLDTPWNYPDLDSALRGLKSPGVVARAIQQSGESQVDRAYMQALAPFCLADGGYRFSARLRCLVTHA